MSTSPGPDSVKSVATGKAARGGDSPTFWGRLAHAGPYRTVTDYVFGSTRRQFVLLAAFPILWVLFAHLGPILQMVRVSFLDSYPPAVGYTPQFTLDNWTGFFKESIFIRPFFRTLMFSVSLTFATLVLIYPVAYFLARHVKRYNQMLLLLMLLIPFWVGEIVRTYAIMILLGNTGAVNLLLKTLGLIERPIPFMYTGFSLSFGIVYLTSLYMLMPLYSALEKIPATYTEAAADLLDEFGIPFEMTIVSAHRTPTRLYDYSKSAIERGLKVIIAGAGGAAHLPGMVAAITALPVIGVPVKSSTLSGNDSLLSIVQMPPGVPVATVAINGAKNAGILAAQVLGTSDLHILKRVQRFKDEMEQMVLIKADAMESGQKAE